MFGVNHNRLKTNLRIVIERLKLLEKKKTEQARKSTKEIADLIQQNKYDRARIKVEHIIRDDYIVEGMELVEMYCDLLLARFGLLESTKEVDPGLYEAIASIIWVTPRLESEVMELHQISEELQQKYGKEFAAMCRSNKCGKVSERLMIKMSEQAPGDLLVEKYLVEITRSHNVPFKPDPNIAVRDPDFFYANMDKPPVTMPNKNEQNGSGGSGGNGGQPQPVRAIYPSPMQVSYIGFDANPAANRNDSAKPKPKPSADDDIALPGVPDSLPSAHHQENSAGNESYDELAARFDRLKKK